MTIPLIYFAVLTCRLSLDPAMRDVLIDNLPCHPGHVEHVQSARVRSVRRADLALLARVERDPAFAKAPLEEAATIFLSYEPETSRVVIRDLVNATLGLDHLAKLTATPSQSLHRMLSPAGKPSMNDLAAIFRAIGSHLEVRLRVHTVRAAS